MKDEGRTLRIVERLADRINILEATLRNDAEKRAKQAYTPRNYYEEAFRTNKELSKPAIACLDAITKRVGKKHWNYMTQEGICKNTRYHIRSIKQGFKELESKGIISTRCRYKSKKNQPPIRTSSIVWLLELSRITLSSAQPEDFSRKSITEIYAGLSVKSKLEILPKLPPEAFFLRPKKAPRNARNLRCVKCKNDAS